MHVRKIIGLGSLGVLSLAGIFGVAKAQDSAAKAPAAPADASLSMRREVKLSPADQLREAEAILGRIEGSGNSVRKQLEMARAQRDVVKSLCLNDKLTQIDVAGRSAKDRVEGLRQAVSRQDEELANHEYTILVVVKQRVEQLAAEANQCIGEEVGFVGETKVTVNIDPNQAADPGVITAESPPGTSPASSPPGQDTVNTPSNPVTTPPEIVSAYY